MTVTTSQTVGVQRRIASVDAYRGLVMLLLLAEVLQTCTVSALVPSSRFWTLFCSQQTHAAWIGASLHDLIQPGFYFLVGIGVLLSMHRRIAAGQTWQAMIGRVAVRSMVLILLGIALQALHPRHWTWQFVDTLTQIGLAYPFLYAIARRPRRDWLAALAIILVAYWAWFALYPLPPAGFDYAAANVPPEWLAANGLSGFATHWQKNSNPAWAFDVWLLNLFPRDAPFIGFDNGLTTLNFVPSIGTMILGLIAGDTLRRRGSSPAATRFFVLTGTLLLIGGLLLNATGAAPAVKAIWTPSWVLFSGGLCFLFLAAFHGIADMAGWSGAVFPLTVIGMNSIVAYALSHAYPALAFNTLRRVTGEAPFKVFGTTYEPFVYGIAVLMMYWLVLYTLYRARVFVRI